MLTSSGQSSGIMYENPSGKTYVGALDFCFTFGDRIFLMTQIPSRLACALSVLVLLTTFEYCFDMVPYMHLVRAYHTPIKGWYVRVPNFNFGLQAWSPANTYLIFVD